MKISYFIAKSNLAFTKYEGFLTLVKELGVKINVDGLNSPKSLVNILQCISRIIEKKVVSKLRRCLA